MQYLELQATDVSFLPINFFCWQVLTVILRAAPPTGACRSRLPPHPEAVGPLPLATSPPSTRRFRIPAAVADIALVRLPAGPVARMAFRPTKWRPQPRDWPPVRGLVPPQCGPISGHCHHPPPLPPPPLCTIIVIRCGVVAVAAEVAPPLSFPRFCRRRTVGLAAAAAVAPADTTPAPSPRLGRRLSQQIRRSAVILLVPCFVPAAAVFDHRFLCPRRERW